MARIAVSRLELEIDRPERVTSTQFRLEEALRLGIDDDGVRVLLVRQLALGRLPHRWAGTGEWTARVETRMRGFAQRAVHALSPLAAQSDAVYFRSELEARTALAALLAAGRQPIGWFWRLAVPVWSGGTWGQSATSLLRDLLVRPGGKVAFARLVVQAMEEGAASNFFAPLTEATVLALWPELTAHLTAPEPIEQEAQGEPTSSAAAASLARSVLAALPPSALPELRRLSSPETMCPVLRHLLATLVVVAHSQHVLAAPRTLMAAANMVLAFATPPAADVELARHWSDGIAAVSAAGVQDRVAHDKPARRSDTTSGDVAPAPEEARGLRRGTAGSGQESSPLIARPPDDNTGAFRDERRSVAAGLFLLIGPLARLGYAAWLEQHPDAAAGSFAWELMRDIARRMRVPEDDPLWSYLPEPGVTPRDLVHAWRVGLDRWLRRRTRIRLADVVKRSGWLSGDATATVARFPLAAADIRLRRLALDIDPGWVPWLARSVTFLYRDRLAT